MRLEPGGLRASPTDLANFLVCRHKTALDLTVAKGELSRPQGDADPLAAVLQQRGEEHEQRYVEKLKLQGLTIADLRGADKAEREQLTLKAMTAGVDVVIQAALRGEHWLGYADVLRRVERPSDFGAWSYEAQDTKLSRETKGGTILQLCVYSDLLGQLQGVTPKNFQVVTPLEALSYRVADVAAYYRLVKQQFIDFLAAPADNTYPEPVGHCDVCVWRPRCNAQRRKDDHLSFVAGLGTSQQQELERQNIKTMARLAEEAMPLAWSPNRGSVEVYLKLREQARLQVKQRTSGVPEYELLPIINPAQSEDKVPPGLCALPEPGAGDLFLDLEGDPFGRQISGPEAGDSGQGTREYLFGLGRVGANGAFEYVARWAFNDAGEKTAFEAVVDEMTATFKAHPKAHIFHYGHYEPSAFKRLMGRYASRESEIDAFLRGGRFVDLLAVVRAAVRAGVENYSIKSMEPLYEFTREVPLDAAGDQRRLVETALELGDVDSITQPIRDTVQGYNKDDCRSTLELRDWFERIRDAEVKKGVAVPRPPEKPAEASEQLTAKQLAVAALRQQLLAGLPLEAQGRTPEQQGRYLMAYLLDWHRREDKAGWWEYFRLLGCSEDELIDEPKAVAGLTFLREVGKEKRSSILRFRYSEQELEIRVGEELKLTDGKKWAEVVTGDRIQRTLDVLVGPSKSELRPTSAFAHKWIDPKEMEAALFTIGEGIAAGHADPLAAELLYARPTKSHNVLELNQSVLAVQGPPGSGKTYTGGVMICDLAVAGKRVGVTATGHKVIRNLLDAVSKEAAGRNVKVKLGHRCRGEAEEDASEAADVAEFGDNDSALEALESGEVNVLGGTAWMWSRPDFKKTVDVLFVDEAGQMSLANTLAVSGAAGSLVLLGDPQQLEQPIKGSHPDGVAVSALQHMLGPHKTMPADRGLFLADTWRFGDALSEFTSEVFYEGKLKSKAGIGLEHQRLAGGPFDGAGLQVVLVDHEGNRSASDEEVDKVIEIISFLTAVGSNWTDREEKTAPITPADILVVSPYNAQVGRLSARLQPLGVEVGTVDKFQGREKPVAIYSMATSSPADAPRGMEFLYNLNRLNVATSRAKCVSILVASPALFEPECRTPRQMLLANALCRYWEMAKRV